MEKCQMKHLKNISIILMMKQGLLYTLDNQVNLIIIFDFYYLTVSK